MWIAQAEKKHPRALPSIPWSGLEPPSKAV